MMYGVVVLPSFVFCSFGLLLFFNFMSGRLHRVALCCTLVLPSVEYSDCCLVYVFVSDDGEIHRRGDQILYSRSPLSEPEKSTHRVPPNYYSRGEYTG